MNNLNRLVPIFFFLLICISCSNEDSSYKATFFSKNKSFFVEDGSFYITDNGSLYYYIEDKTLIDEICNQETIDSIKFEIDSKKYLAMPINLTFSRVRHNSDFIFPVNNKTHKIVLDTYGEKSMFTLASEKTNIDDLIKSKILKPILIKE